MMAGSCHLWLGRGACRLPLTVVAEGGCMAIKVLSRPLKTQPYQQNGGAGTAAMAINRVASSRYRSRRHRLP
ncbi:hypothetical protein [Escherichia coli]|uniref:hypothetical protein n=1 Tax=Escherichia coli TaxID=562 RepID=UPI00388EB74C